jgi:hypothetical protein
MKFFNLTDVRTKALKQHKLFKQAIVVAGQLIEPGGSLELKEVTAHQLAAAQHLVKVHALAVDELPQFYLDAKGSPALPPAPSPPQAPTATDTTPPVSKRSKAL